MLLSDESIRQAIESGYIPVSPTPDYDTQLQPASLDIRLGDEYARIDTPEVGNGVYENCETLRFKPYTFYLATTRETIGIPDDITAQLTGRSSIGRKGLLIHATAGLLDAGWEGEITLEVFNLSHRTVELEAGTRIGQVVFQKMDQPAARPYDQKPDAKYHGQSGPTTSRLDEDTDTDTPATTD
jgi:dCTP deaminase